MSLILYLSIRQAKQDGKNFSQMAKLADLLTLRSYKHFIITPVANKVLIANFTKLVIQNLIVICRRSIVITLSNTDAVSAYNRICMFTIHYFLVQTNLL